MKVEVWSDFVCPFCYIGKRKFETALQQFVHKDQVVTEFKSFELDPHADSSARVSTNEMLAKKYGMSIEQAKAANANVAQTAAEVGITFRVEGQLVQNTFDAHRLAQFAAAEGRGAEMAERLFRAHFTENEPIGDKECLVRLAEEAGLDTEKVKSMLASDGYAEVVHEQEQEGSRLGIRGVPFFVIDRKYAVSGAQSPAVFLDTLQKAWSEKYPELVQVDGADDAACADGYCAPGSDKE